jgi:segregation and condensation protein B
VEEAVPAEAPPPWDEDWVRLAEGLIFASASPVPARRLAQILPEQADLDAVLNALRARYDGRGVELIEAGGGFMFRTAPDLAPRLRKVVEVPRRLPRAAMETLAIIAYHQPVTRAEIEEIRGVITSKGTLDVLLETGWIRPRGRRKTPGRPLTFGTTEAFLSQFSLEALSDLPGLEELKGTGLMDSRLPSGFSVPTPSDDPALRDDEDPLDIGDLELALAPAVEPEDGDGT